MTRVMTKPTNGWYFRSRYACVDALCVAQGRTMPFCGKQLGTKLL